MTKIGLISDTHDNVPNVMKAVEVFKKKRVDFVIHSGDIIAPVTINFFKGIKAKFIKGNCDGDIENIKKIAEEQGSEYLGEAGTLSIDGKHIFVTHKPDDAEQAAKSGRYSYVIHGHTHQKRDDKIGIARIINPGGHYWGGSETIAILDLEKDKIEFISLKEDAEENKVQ